MHRHLTLEQYEWALEDAPPEAQRMLAAASTCGGCAVALSSTSLTPVLSAWELPPAVNKPVEWRDALRLAVAPAPAVRERAHFGRRPLALGAATAAALMALTVVPAAASAGPESPLFGVRGAQEHARLAITPQDRRAALEADLATSYLVMAHDNANHQDRAAYESSMGRFFEWGALLKQDVKAASPAEKPRVRATVDKALPLMRSLATSPADTGQAQRAQAILLDVQGESQSQSGNGDHPAGTGPGGTQGGQTGGSGTQTNQSEQPPASSPRLADEPGDGAQGPSQSPEGNGEHPGGG
jgi:hypothetical protein